MTDAAAPRRLRQAYDAGQLMSRIWTYLGIISIVGSPTPVGAQERPLAPQLEDARLWVVDDAVPAAPTDVRPPSSPKRESFVTSFAAGYVLGGLMGVGVAMKAPPPKEMGLWLGGWYQGSLPTGPSDPSTFPYHRPAFGSFGAASDPPLVDGITRGFLAALAWTSR